MEQYPNVVNSQWSDGSWWSLSMEEEPGTDARHRHRGTWQPLAGSTSTRSLCMCVCAYRNIDGDTDGMDKDQGAKIALSLGCTEQMEVEDAVGGDLDRGIA